MRTKKRQKLKIKNPDAAGIDIGSRSHFIAVGQNQEDVKEFQLLNEKIVETELKEEKYIQQINLLKKKNNEYEN